MNKEELRTIIGENIRQNRISHDMSVEELSEKLGTTPSYVGMIERGTRGTVPHTLYKLSYIFDVSIDSFFCETETDSYNKSQKLRKKISSYISDFSSKELHFVIKLAQGIQRMNHLSDVDSESEDDEIS